MATVNSGIREDANFLNLKEIAQKQVKSEVNNMLVTGENIIQCFQTVRDQVVFTDKRVIVVNVQGITGKKTSYFFSLISDQKQTSKEFVQIYSSIFYKIDF